MMTHTAPEARRCRPRAIVAPVLRHRSGSWLLLLLVAAMTFALWPASAFAHSERPTKAPDGTGTVPVYRTTGPHLVVCKTDTADFTTRIAAFPTDLRIRNLELYAECLDHGYRDLQSAVDHVTDAGTTIYVLPGIYLEEPSLAPESDACNHLVAPRAKAGYQILSYEQQQVMSAPAEPGGHLRRQGPFRSKAPALRVRTSSSMPSSRSST